ncbi:peptide chain release factor N(5)-glutamine methyltransferase [Candidatus Schneideria nysicola]|uniref:peptide chain release factor N(5)-glutamine methyltransferase n=1 Tax=Candidatus Schneideria nysicola TaxID=1081631 RepID=UPI001CAA44A8|nr:peptide chain release factor N(5)-glutamine methyltransferase [Candidatus Schneideria nysicola]UAJ66162.1 peptide chain release factor N(5)-glutamine methyltransferase [Candidatus Schneideria nysicola]
MNWNQWLRQASKRLSLSPMINSILEAEILLGKVTGFSRAKLLAYSDTKITDTEYRELETLLKRRELGEPIAYLIGKREFWSLPFSVNSATFIPRADTECLVEQTLNLFANIEIRVLELGTGTGAITCALAYERSKWFIVGIDSSIEAIKLARYNQISLKINNIQFICGDWFNPLKKIAYHIIVSNPPYLSENDPYLNIGDVRFEPKYALISGKKGVEQITIICNSAKKYLLSGGWLVLEHAWNQGKYVRNLFASTGFFHINTFKDYTGNERVTLGRVY